jgi:hypothetical protein
LAVGSYQLAVKAQNQKLMAIKKQAESIKVLNFLKIFSL